MPLAAPCAWSKSWAFSRVKKTKGARAVLSAAALTYVATAFTAFLTLLYYVMLISRRR